MALGDITILENSNTNGRGSRTLYVAATATLINAGEPVVMVAGASSVTKGATNMVTLASPYVPLSVTGTGVVGIAETTSTNTASAQGTVNVLPVTSQTTYLINANSAGAISTQALYDSFVGDRVLIDFTSSIYTLLTTDSALNGCIIVPLDTAKYPGKIAFQFRDGVAATQ